MVNGEKMMVYFKGLFPFAIEKGHGNYLYHQELEFFSEVFSLFATQLEYIGPLREPAHRTYSYSGSVPKKLGYKGEFAPQILGTSTFINDELLANVGGWFKKHLGYELSISKEIKSFEVVLVNPHNPAIQINLVDVGQGISQVFPLIVRCFSPNYFNAITIVEQPELHLHPAAHGDLAELFALTAKKENSTFIIETHSENVILRLRRMVTEKKISAEDVIIYWIDEDGLEGSFIQPITIDESGALSDWPEGVFSEDYEEVLAISAAQKKTPRK
jgi:predicted ATPase